MAAQTDHIQAPDRVETRLLQEFRVQAGNRLRPARSPWIAVLSWATMAAMIAAGIWIVRERQPETVRLANRHSVEMAVADISSEEPSEDGFVPLPGAAQLAPSEYLDLVRVELPRSAMMQIGIEVSPERAAEPVQADVMVGSDGLARSVRFLEPTGSD